MDDECTKVSISYYPKRSLTNQNKQELFKISVESMCVFTNQENEAKKYMEQKMWKRGSFDCFTSRFNIRPGITRTARQKINDEKHNYDGPRHPEGGRHQANNNEENSETSKKRES